MYLKSSKTQTQWSSYNSSLQDLPTIPMWPSWFPTTRLPFPCTSRLHFGQDQSQNPKTLILILIRMTNRLVWPLLNTSNSMVMKILLFSLKKSSSHGLQYL